MIKTAGERLVVPLLALGLVATASVGVTYASSSTKGVKACETSKGVLVVASTKDTCPKGDHRVTIGKAGARGKTGPSNGYATTSSGDVTLGASATTIASETLPAGSYLISSSVAVMNDDVGNTQLGFCNFSEAGKNSMVYFVETSAAVQVIGVIPGGGSVSMTSGLTLPTSTVLSVQCEGSDSLQAAASLDAQKVGTLTPSGAGFS